MVSENESPIFIFDGFCNLCNWAVDFIMKNDKTGTIHFSSIQSLQAKVILERAGKSTNLIDTSYFYKNGILFDEAAAALEIAKYLKKPWYYLKYFNILPLPLLNYFYKIISKNRYKIFGKKETCRIPTEVEKSRFLE